MTVVSVRGLNVTAKLTQKGGNKNGAGNGQQSNKGTEIGDDLGRVETEGDDDLDLQLIGQVHQQKKQEADQQKKAFGVSHNIFDVSSYGEVQLHKFIEASKNEPTTNQNGGAFYKPEHI